MLIKTLLTIMKFTTAMHVHVSFCHGCEVQADLRKPLRNHYSHRGPTLFSISTDYIHRSTADIITKSRGNSQLLSPGVTVTRKLMNYSNLISKSEVCNEINATIPLSDLKPSRCLVNPNQYNGYCFFTHSQTISFIA